MDNVFIAIIGYIIGPLLMMSVRYFAKKYSDPKITFDRNYYIPSLATMIIMIVTSPLFVWVSVGINDWFILLSTISMSFTANTILNLPITYIMKQLKNAPRPTATMVSSGIDVKKAFFAVVIVALIFGVAASGVYAATVYYSSYSSHGKIKTIGCAVYSDVYGVNQITDLNWGVLEPGENVTQTYYVKDTGNHEINLVFTTNNYSPAGAQEYLTFSTDYTGQVIQPGALIPVKFNLYVSPSITGITDFSFDITITSSG